MKLGDIFAQASKGSGVYRAPTKRVKFKVMQEIDGELHWADAEAALRFVPEDEAEDGRIAAEVELRKKFKGDVVPTDLLADARAFELLHRSLRDADDDRVAFAQSTQALKSALQVREAQRLHQAYLEWAHEEFPDLVDDETFEELVEAASKKSLPDLFSQFDSSKIRRAWGSLVAHFGKSQTPTSGAGEPG